MNKFKKFVQEKYYLILRALGFLPVRSPYIPGKPYFVGQAGYWELIRFFEVFTIAYFGRGE